ncbi:MAG: hypothetical protein HYY18_11300 [Planctomycetes bacterium]|nr:hypothetical protein [Planctomycetota bacterium]
MLRHVILTITIVAAQIGFRTEAQTSTPEAILREAIDRSGLDPGPSLSGPPRLNAVDLGVALADFATLMSGMAGDVRSADASYSSEKGKKPILVRWSRDAISPSAENEIVILTGNDLVTMAIESQVDNTAIYVVCDPGTSTAAAATALGLGGGKSPTVVACAVG